MEDPVVPLERNLYGHPLAGLLWERQFEKNRLKYGWETVPNWECLFVNPEKDLLERNKILTHCGEYLRKTLIWENGHHSLTMFIWVVVNEKVK